MKLKVLKQKANIKIQKLKKIDNSIIYAQAKSIQDGSLTNRMLKLEDAIISLAKTPATKDDALLYICC